VPQCPGKTQPGIGGELSTDEEENNNIHHQVVTRKAQSNRLAKKDQPWKKAAGGSGSGGSGSGGSGSGETSEPDSDTGGG